MKNWVLAVENDFVGQIIFRKDNNDDGDFGLSVTVYNEVEGYFASSFMSFGENQDLMDENFDKLASEEGHKTINRIAEQLVMF
uniref:Uncharacterized protein n=5 Tax=Vibrionaceae TaxID=641 RepID=A0A0H3ZQ28_VIBSP|nr:hypothetical protein [Vibrio splendidus]AKN37299.1 hypothetical protein [Aliivibrio fischeri]AKN38764.1 hypothetical protein [Enterovibrio norvegicus]AKN39153.1 hypothetical protein [Vibrio kanaloae]AKN40761.1 hypothetical protein [Vibrio tasmaniensis]